MRKSLIISLFVYLCVPVALSSDGCPFVDLTKAVPSLVTSARYASSENFLGHVVPGYEHHRFVMTREAAAALGKAQELASAQGYTLVVYDTYRPQRSVNAFMAWSDDPTDQARKAHYYPHVDKARVFELGYVAEKSGHSRGSTVDLTLLPLGSTLSPVTVSQRTLLDGREVPFLDDGTLDMGTSFDLFDQSSHYENDLVAEEYKARRTLLKNIMEAAGFKNYAEEWWHFTLKNEPFPESYFDFLPSEVRH